MKLLYCSLYFMSPFNPLMSMHLVFLSGKLHQNLLPELAIIRKISNSTDHYSCNRFTQYFDLLLESITQVIKKKASDPYM